MEFRMSRVIAGHNIFKQLSSQNAGLSLQSFPCENNAA